MIMLSWGNIQKFVFFKHSESLSIEMMLSIKGRFKNTGFTVETYIWLRKVGRYHKPVVFPFFLYQNIISDLQPALQTLAPSILNLRYFSTLLCSCKEGKINPHIRICKRSFTVSQSNSK